MCQQNETYQILESYSTLFSLSLSLSLSPPLSAAPAIIDPGENTTTNVPEDGIDYFQTECSAFSSTVLVELTDINGTSFLYCSATEANPGPLTDDTIRNETQGLNRRTCTVPLPSGSTVSEALHVTDRILFFFEDHLL